MTQSDMEGFSISQFAWCKRDGKTGIDAREKVVQQREYGDCNPEMQLDLKVLNQ